MDTVISTINKIKAYSNKIGNINSRKRRHLIQSLKQFKKNYTLSYSKSNATRCQTLNCLRSGECFSHWTCFHILIHLFFMLNTYSFENWYYLKNAISFRPWWYRTFFNFPEVRLVVHITVGERNREKKIVCFKWSMDGLDKYLITLWGWMRPFSHKRKYFDSDEPWCKRKIIRLHMMQLPSNSWWPILYREAWFEQT